MQIHDFNPGIAPSGLFWTILVPNDAVRVNLRTQTASFAYDSLAVPDFHDFTNSLLARRPHCRDSRPSTCNGAARRARPRSAIRGKLRGVFFQDTATITFTVASPAQNNFTFTSDPASTSTSQFAEIGVERNGVFFH